MGKSNEQKKTTKKWYKKWWVWVIFIFLVLVIALSEEPKPEPKSENKSEVIDYIIEKEGDTSYAGWKRLEYKALVKDDATKDEIKGVIEEIYEKKKNLSDKIFIFVYRQSDKDKIDETFYRGRLFMDPNCDKSNDYEIDFEYWDLSDLSDLYDDNSEYEECMNEVKEREEMIDKCATDACRDVFLTDTTARTEADCLELK